MEINNTNSSMTTDNSNVSHAFGAELKRARLDKDLSLEDASKETFILKRHLQALEEENFDQLPQAAFTRGFAINYAKFLGLDAHRIASQLDAAYPDHLKTKSVQDIESPLQPMGTLQREGGRSLKINPLLVIGIILLIAFGIFLMRVVGNAQERNVLEEQNSTLEEELSASDQVAGAYIPSTTNNDNLSNNNLSNDNLSNNNLSNGSGLGDNTLNNTTGSATPQGTSGAAIASAGLNSQSTTTQRGTTSNTTGVTAGTTAPTSTFNTMPTTSNTTSTTSPRVANIAVPAGQNSTIELWVQDDTTIQVVDASGKTLIEGLQNRGGYELEGLPPFKVLIDNVNRVSLDLNQKKVRLSDYAEDNKANFTLGSTS